MSQGKLLGIAIRRRSRAPMETLAHAEITRDAGIIGDSRGKPGQRQVTVLTEESWLAACNDVGTDLPWTIRRANLFVRGLQLVENVGATIRLGDVLLEVTGETDPCNRMDEQCPNLQKALTPDWRGGVCCRVVSDGIVHVGDSVCLSEAKSE